MGWPLKTTERELVDAFTDYIKNNSNILPKYNILIWGASVRGTVLGMLLEKHGYAQFGYIDNDERKWGENINGHVIVSPENVKRFISDYYILIPIEYGDEIKLQLENWGLIEELNFVILKAKINENFASEFFRIYQNKRLVLGESFLNETVLAEKHPKSIKERIWEEFGKEETKILSMNCMGMQSFYHVLRLQIKLGYKPEKLWLFVSYETLTEFHHLLSRTQHVGALELIQEKGNINDVDFMEYIQIAKKRAANYRIELQYSPQRTTNDKEMNMEEIQKSYLRINLLHNINLKSEEVQYLKKILETSAKEGIMPYIILTPVNYELARKYCGKEFDNIYNSNNLKLKKFIVNLGAIYFNMGTLLTAKNFIAVETINDGIYGEGQKKVIQYLNKIENKGKSLENMEVT